MKKYLIGLLVIIGVAAPACSELGDQTKRDLENIDMQDPDSYEVWAAPDRFPNIGRVCIDGVAFASTTRTRQQLLRVPEWDEKCPGHTPKPRG